MIELTRLNGAKFTLNAEIIESLEASPKSTVVHLATNNRYIVTESGGFQGLGFAVTSQTAKERLLDRGPMWSPVRRLALAAPPAREADRHGGSAGTCGDQGCRVIRPRS